VLKLGGRVAAQTAVQAHAWRRAGFDVVVVHGAGPQISAELEARGVTARFVDGRRVTSPAVMEVVRASLQAVNAEVCRAVGPLAVGLMGDELGLPAVPVAGLGLVGEPLPAAPAAVVEALDRGLVPVVAPLAAGPLNVNADEAAAALAVGLEAERIAFVSDVPGVYLGDRVADVIPADEADRLLGGGLLEGGIVPKLTAAVRAVRGGVRAQIGATEVVA
jgi:acetylglutamate kinase